jgi:hypothetical protein
MKSAFETLPIGNRTGQRAHAIYSYDVYGITIQSEIPFPLAESETPLNPVLELRLGDASDFRRALRGHTVEPDPAHWYEHLNLPDGSVYQRWPDMFEFLVSADGRIITCRPFLEASSGALETYLLTIVLSTSLLKLGYEVLHATAVIVDGCALAFLGPSGFGKSSLAACFLTAGYPVLTDDLLVLTWNRGLAQVPPGLPRIKLLPEAAERFLPTALDSVPMNPLTQKRVIPLSDSQAWSAPVPLGAIYLLPYPSATAPRRTVWIARCPAKAAFKELLAGTFNARAQDPARLKRQFENASRLHATIPIRRLGYQRHLEHLPMVRDAIVADFRRVRQTA